MPTIPKTTYRASQAASPPTTRSPGGAERRYALLETPLLGKVLSGKVLSVAVLLGAVVAAACTSTSSQSRPTRMHPSEATTTSSPATPTYCQNLKAAASGQLENDGLTEVSGLVVSATQLVNTQPLIWLHNDSGTNPSLFATNPDGADLGRFELSEATDGISAEDLQASDIEDLALFDGIVYLADIGDNNDKRATVRVYSFAEPHLAAGAAGSQATIDEATVTPLSYPDGAHNAEAFAIDPQSGEFLIITKTVGIRLGSGRAVGATSARVYSAALSSLGQGQPVELRELGEINAAALDRRASQRAAEGTVRNFGLDGVITGADITAGGQLIALRTYGSVWIFERQPGQPIAAALRGPGCEAPVVPEATGEAVGFAPLTAKQLAAGEPISFFTIGEQLNAPIHRTE